MNTSSWTNFNRAAACLVATVVFGCAPQATPRLAAQAGTLHHVSASTTLANKAAQAPGFPCGRFGAETIAGRVTLLIRPDGGFDVRIGDTIVDSGRFIGMHGPQISVETAQCGRQGFDVAPYTWTYGAGPLTFRDVGSDPCEPRRQLLRGEFQLRFMFR